MATATTQDRVLVGKREFLSDLTLVSWVFRAFSLHVTALYSNVRPGYCWVAPTSTTSPTQTRQLAVSGIVVVNGKGTRPSNLPAEPDNLVKMRWTSSTGTNATARTLVQVDWKANGTKYRYQAAACRFWYLGTAEGRAALLQNDCDGGHMCHNASCIHCWHVVLEDNEVNKSRNACCPSEETHKCGHDLPCALPGIHFPSRPDALTTLSMLPNGRSLAHGASRLPLSVADRARLLRAWQERQGLPEATVPALPALVGAEGEQPTWLVVFMGPQTPQELAPLLQLPDDSHVSAGREACRLRGAPKRSRDESA